MGMAQDAELAFVATMRDEASAVAKSARKTLDSVGGATKPVETALLVEAGKAKASVAEVERELEGVSAVAEREGEEAGKGLGDGIAGGLSGMKGKIVGAIGALGIGAALVEGLDVEAGSDKLAASLGATAREARQYGKVAGDLYAGAWGDSLDDVNGAVAAVATSIDGLGRGKGLQDATARALDYATTFEVDVARAAQVAGQAVRTGLAKDATEAFDLITAASQKVPANLREDVLDAADEYGPFFKALGYDGAAAFGTLAAGADKGMYGIDKAGDAIKEFTIRSTDMSTASKDAYKAIGLDAQAMAADILAGGDRAKGATDKIIDGILGIENPVKRANTAIALFGTPLEDLGVQEIPKFLKSLSGAEGALGKVEGASKRAGDTLNDNARTNLTSFGRQAKLALVDVLGGQVLPAVSELADYLSTNFGPTLETVGGYVKDFGGFLRDNEGAVRVIVGAIITLLIPHYILAGVEAIKSATKSVAAWAMQRGAAIKSVATHVAAAAVFVAKWAWMGAKALVHAAKVAAAWLIALGPIGLIIAAVVGIAALVIANWDKIRAWTVKAWNAVKAATSKAWSAIRSGVLSAWKAIKSGVEKAVAGVRGVISKVFGAIVGLIRGYVNAWRTIITSVWNAIKSVVSSVVNTVRSVISRGFSAIRSGISSAMNAAKSIVTNAWNAIRNGISNAIGGILSVVRSIPGKIKSALGNLGSLLLSAGGDVIRGFTQGIRNMAGTVISAVRSSITDKLPGFVKKALGIASPSKVFAALGGWTVAGFVKGLRRGGKSLDKTLDRLFAGIPKYVAARIKSDKLAARTSRQTIRNLRDEVRALERNARARANLTKRLKDARKAGAEFAQAIRDSANVASVERVNDTPLTAGFVLRGLEERLEAIRRFRDNLATMRRRGFDKRTIDQVMAAGVEQGGETAAALATATDEQVKAIRSAQRSINVESTKAGNESVRGLVNGINREIRQVERAGRRLARALTRAIRKELRIASPSKETAEDGAHVVAGLAGGMLDEVRSAEAAARSVADRVSTAITPTIPDLARMANGLAVRPAVIRSSEVVTIRHEIVSPDGSVSTMTAEEIADVIARDPKSARRLETVLRPARRRNDRNTISSSD